MFANVVRTDPKDRMKKKTRKKYKMTVIIEQNITDSLLPEPMQLPEIREVIIDNENYCLGCGVAMGECNPRQYCRKWHCPVEDERIRLLVEELKRKKRKRKRMKKNKKKNKYRK